jgi:hypothetical protein
MPAWAAIYSQVDTIIEPAKLKELSANANIDVISHPDAGTVKQFDVNWGAHSVSINVMHPDFIPEHINGFLGWLAVVKEARGPFEDDGERAWDELLDWVSATRQVLGMVIEPALDADGLLRGFVRDLAAFYDGIIFADDAIYLSTGHLIIGPDGAQDYI